MARARVDLIRGRSLDFMGRKFTPNKPQVLTDVELIEACESHGSLRVTRLGAEKPVVAPPPPIQAEPPDEDDVVEEDEEDGEDEAEEGEEEESATYTMADLKKLKKAQLAEIADNLGFETDGATVPQLVEGILSAQG